MGFFDFFKSNSNDNKSLTPFTEYWSNGNIRSKGHRKGDNLEGLVIDYLKNGNKLLEINYNEGLWDGLCKEYSIENHGKLVKEGLYEKGVKIQETSYEYYENGNVKEIITTKDDDVLHGPYKLFYENGELKEEGVFENGGIRRSTKVYHENGELKEEGILENNERIGQWRFYYYSGELENEMNFNKNKLNEFSKSYYENGNIKSEGHFSSGLYNGLWKEYHENGNLMYEGEYKNGESQGVFKYYYENGQLKEEKTYKDGKEIKN